MSLPILEFYDVMLYVGNGQRPYVEGTAILNAKHLMECGILSRSENEIRFLGLCLQSSCLDGKPHEIKISVGKSPTRVTEATCSCKAGSNKCKHVVAFLLFLNRQSIDDMEDLSCTDVTQQWGRMKAEAKAMYLAVPSSRFCHTEKKLMPYNGRYQPKRKTPEMLDLLRNTILAGAPDSALAVHLSNCRARSTPVHIEPEDDEQSADETQPHPTDYVGSTTHISITKWNEADNLQLAHCTPDEAEFYKKNVVLTCSDAITVCLDTTGQVGDLWHAQRKLRITGSRCYELFTYAKPSRVSRNWDAKLNGLIFSSFKGNCHTVYGLKNEPNAIAAYERQTGDVVSKFGLLINHNIPWMGYSPDGIVTKSGNLIEVKCLEIGKSLSGLAMMREVGCVTVEGDVVTLKKKHKYYGQVQLGMLISGLQSCSFLVYSKVIDESFVVKVPFDQNFAYELVASLRPVYFEKVLPFLIKNDSKLS